MSERQNMEALKSFERLEVISDVNVSHDKEIVVLIDKIYDKQKSKRQITCDTIINAIVFKGT